MRPDLAAQGLGDVDRGRDDRKRDREKSERMPPAFWSSRRRARGRAPGRCWSTTNSSEDGG